MPPSMTLDLQLVSKPAYSSSSISLECRLTLNQQQGQVGVGQAGRGGSTSAAGAAAAGSARTFARLMAGCTAIDGLLVTRKVVLEEVQEPLVVSDSAELWKGCSRENTSRMSARGSCCTV